MKAMVYTQFGPPEVLQLREVEKPTPKDNKVLIKIVATTVVKEDPDLRASPGFNGLLKPRNPILGQEMAGEIEAIGRAVIHFRPGDPVFDIDMFGAYAQYKCMPENGALALKPANIAICKNMKNRLVPLLDKLLARKRSLIETINDQLKNISQIEHSRHRSVTNFMVNLVAG